MKIENVKSSKATLFRFIEMGECFRYDDRLLMKCGIGKVGINAIDLSNGAQLIIELDEEVEPTVAKVVVGSEGE